MKASNREKKGQTAERKDYSLLAIRTKALIVVGRGEKEKETINKCEDGRWDEQKTKQKSRMISRLPCNSLDCGTYTTNSLRKEPCGRCCNRQHKSSTFPLNFPRGIVAYLLTRWSSVRIVNSPGDSRSMMIESCTANQTEIGRGFLVM